MNPYNLQTEVRNSRGKGPARRLRSAGKVPAVFYGPDSETTVLAVSPKDLRKALTTEHRRNQLIELEFGGKKELAMVKELQIHPVTRTVLHVDFYGVSPEREIEVKVPVLTHGRAAGVVAGGSIRVPFRELPLRCTPDRTPASITIDVTPLELNTQVLVRDLKLPEGVTVLFGADKVVVAVEEPRRGRAGKGTDEAEEEATA